MIVVKQMDEVITMNKDVRNMSLKEAKEYLTEKLEAIYQEEKRVAADLKVITLMLHKDKEDVNEN